MCDFKSIHDFKHYCANIDWYECIECTECDSYICNLCDASIEYDEIIYDQFDEHLGKVFEKHELICPKTNIEKTDDHMHQNNDSCWTKRYCNKCKNKDNELQDTVNVCSEDYNRHDITFKQYMGEKYVEPVFPLKVVEIETYPKETFERESEKIKQLIDEEYSKRIIPPEKPKFESPPYTEKDYTVRNVTIRLTLGI